MLLLYSAIGFCIADNVRITVHIVNSGGNAPRRGFKLDKCFGPRREHARANSWNSLEVEVEKQYSNYERATPRSTSRNGVLVLHLSAYAREVC